MGVHSQNFEVLCDGLKMDDLTQHGHLLILRHGDTGTRDVLIQIQRQDFRGLFSVELSLQRGLRLPLTTTGRSMDTKMQKRARSSISAFLTACFSVSSSSRYLSVTSWTALCSWGWMSPLPAAHHTFSTHVTTVPESSYVAWYIIIINITTIIININNIIMNRRSEIFIFNVKNFSKIFKNVR